MPPDFEPDAVELADDVPDPLAELDELDELPQALIAIAATSASSTAAAGLLRRFMRDSS